MTHTSPSPPNQVRRLPGRPRIQAPGAPQKNKRREQLRNAQDSYRERKQKEILHIRKMNISMRAAASTLGTSLAGLLEHIVDGNGLQHDLPLAEQLANSVRNMLLLVEVMQEDKVETIDSTIEVLSQEPMPTKVPTTYSKNLDAFSQDTQLAIYPTSQINTQLITTRYPGPIFNNGDLTDLKLLPSSLANTSPHTTQYLTSGSFLQEHKSALFDWFAAKSILLDPALDLYTTPSRRQISLADRINHHALLRAGRLLENPSTTMDLVYKIFPFDKTPAPPHIQLAKINHLISKSQPFINAAQSRSVPPRSSKNLRCSHGHQSCTECRHKLYPVWLSARDIEYYLSDKWSVSLDSDQPHLMLFRVDSEQQQVTDLKLKILDLIDGFIENGVCLVDVPAFERAEVDRVVSSLIKTSRKPLV